MPVNPAVQRFAKPYGPKLLAAAKVALSGLRAKNILDKLAKLPKSTQS